MLIAKIKRTIRVRHLLKCLQVFLFEQVNPQPVTPNTLLIIRLDAIGDYILFRNFIEQIRFSKQYNKHRITILANKLWQPLAEEFDFKFADEWLWVDKQQFTTDKNYRKKIVDLVASKGFETAIFPNAARDFLNGDSLVRASGATFKIGAVASKTIDPWLIGMLGNSCYNKLINNANQTFEFNKNLSFFEQLLNQNISITKPYFSLNHHHKKLQIIILPGAGEKKRQWSSTHFVKLITLLQNYNTNYHITLCGAPSDGDKISEINNLLNQKVTTCIGCLPLNQLVHEMSQSSLVIAHDSGGLHMAIASSTPSIGLMTGKHYKRFAPYAQAEKKHRFIFPIDELTLTNWHNKYGATYFEDVFLDINKIEPELVFNTAKELLG